MSKDKKALFTGTIEKDEEGNFFCGAYLLDYKMVMNDFKVGDIINVKSCIENPSDKSYDRYPKKSKLFFLNSNQALTRIKRETLNRRFLYKFV